MESDIQDVIFGILSKFRDIVGCEVQLKIDSSGMLYLVKLQNQEQIGRFDTFNDFLQIGGILELIEKKKQ
jgi:hypothetical protein